MESNKNKYDTNPLDPDVERKTSETWGDGVSGVQTRPVQGPTRKVGGPQDESSRKNVYSEAPTRRYDSPPLEAPYPSVFVPPTYSPPVKQQFTGSPYQPPKYNSSPAHPVAGFGIPERWATMLAYCPSYIGLVVSLLELFLVPRREVKVRFHASQAIALHIAILIVQTVFAAIHAITGSSIGGTLFGVLSFAFLIISMIKVWRGSSHRIEPVAEAAQWFNEHIEPRKQV
jgi:uncharacterized membrane protein